MSVTENARIFRRYIEEVDPTSDVAALPDLIHPDIALPADTIPNGRQGIDGLREHLEFLRDKLSYRSTIEDIVVQEDKVAARVIVRGRLIDDFMGFPADGREFAIEEFLIAHFRDGKISQIWRLVDLMSLTAQLKGE